MASPFRVFRKYQKPIIVVAGVGLLVVWLLGDALTSWAVRAFGGPGGPRSGQQTNEVAVTYRGGQLTRGELDALVFKRRVLIQFLGSVHSLARTRAEPDATLAVSPIVPFGLQRDDPNIRENVFYSFLLGEAAKREGMAVGDKAVNQYLTEVCMKKVYSHELSEIASRMSQGNRVITMAFIFNELRRELLAFGYLQSQQFALLQSQQRPFVYINSLPEQRFTDWLRINDRINLEVAALPASLFAVDVKQPSDAEVQALYDHYKDVEPTRDIVGSADLPSPKPGFKTPRRVRLKYLEINFDDVLSQLVAEVTEEEVAAYYEENKDPDFIRPDIDVQPLEDEPGEAAAESTEPADADETGKARTPAADEAAHADDESAPAADEPAAPDDESDVPADESADPADDAAEADAEAEDSAGDGDPAPEADADAEKPDAEDAGEPADALDEPGDEGDDDNATIDRKTPFRLVAFQEEDGAEPTTDSEAIGDESAPADPTDVPATDGQLADDTAAEGPAAEDAAAEDTAAEDAAAEDTAAEDTAAEDTAAEDTAAEDTAAEDTAAEDTAAEDTAAEDAAAEDAAAEDTAAEDTAATEEAEEGDPEPPIDDQPAADPPIREEKPVEFVPLDEVREEIRERIAADRVPQRQGEISSEIISQLQIAFDDYETRLLESQESDESADIGPPNFEFEKLAEEHGARLEETSDVSFLELRQMDPIGISALRASGMAFGTAVCQAVFQDEELYRPIVSTQQIGLADPATGTYRVNEFATVKVSDTPALVPELDEIRDEVIRAWRLQRASELALAEAKDLAEEARGSEQSLAAMLEDNEEIEVTDTDAFSWLTMGFDARRVRLSEPYGVEAAGPDFMRDVFAMTAGDVKAVLNHDHSIAYVVRMVGHEKGQDELRRDFLAEVDRWYGMPVLAAVHRNEMNRAYGSGLESLYEVEWQIDPAEQRK